MSSSMSVLGGATGTVLVVKVPVVEVLLVNGRRGTRLLPILLAAVSYSRLLLRRRTQCIDYHNSGHFKLERFLSILECSYKVERFQTNFRSLKTTPYVRVERFRHCRKVPFRDTYIQIMTAGSDSTGDSRRKWLAQVFATDTTTTDREKSSLVSCRRTLRSSTVLPIVYGTVQPR
jgi:hypothetical protein